MKGSGPRGHVLLGNVRELVQNPLEFLHGCFREYGDVVQISLGPLVMGDRYWLFAHPTDVERVLKTNQGNYRKSPTYRPIGQFLGDGLLTSEGDVWKRHRRLAQPSFYKRTIDGFVPAMGEACGPTLSAWSKRDGTTVDVAHEMSRLTLAVVGRVLFTVDLIEEGDVVGPALGRAQDHMIKRTPFSVSDRLLRALDRLPTWENKTYREAVGSLDEIVEEIISSHRRSPQEFDDLLSRLMAASDAEGPGLSDKEIRDEVMTFLLAGHETTANALGWTLHLLAKNPDVRSSLEHEIDGVLGGRVPTVDDLSNLPFTSAVLKEAMRLFPPAWLIEREAIGADLVGGQKIKSGDLIATSPYITHRHPDFWDDPEHFDPERFTTPDPQRHPFSLFPFGGGRRQCIGAGFAMAEATVLLALIVAGFRFDLTNDEDPGLDPKITLRPLNGLPMELSKRWS